MKYETLEMEIILLHVADCICASGELEEENPFAPGDFDF